MPVKKGAEIAPAKGKLGVLLVGLGAVSTTFIAGVEAIKKELLNKLRKPLQKITPMKAVFDQTYVKRLSGTNVKKGKNKLELARQLIDEIAEFKRKHKCDRLVMIWAASTEIFMKPHTVHRDLKSLERAMRDNHKAIAPSMIYAYAALKSGIPFANGAPNLTVDIPAMMALANQKG